eukprot:13732680-Alexandrium_andersonii.AAC.1
MSASLVGSEMCIRDRPPLERSQVQEAAGRPSPPMLLREQPWPRRGGVPVSYTHLTLPTICSV